MQYLAYIHRFSSFLGTFDLFNSLPSNSYIIELYCIMLKVVLNEIIIFCGERDNILQFNSFSRSCWGSFRPLVIAVVVILLFVDVVIYSLNLYVLKF